MILSNSNINQTADSQISEKHGYYARALKPQVDGTLEPVMMSQ